MYILIGSLCYCKQIKGDVKYAYKNVGQSVDPTKSIVPMEQKSVQDIWRPGD